jgi:lysophospholipase L1-like esterase
MVLESDDLVLFQGDSITDAFRKPEEVGTSYRLGAGWAMMAAAKLMAEHPEMNLRFENRGVSGNGLRHLHERWDADTLALRPDVLSLLIGVNETYACKANGESRPLDEFAASYRRLLDRTRQALPGIRLILCEPFLLEVGGIKADWLADMRERQAVVRTVARDFGALFVPLQEPLDQAAARTGAAHWLFDGIHPHAAGQWLIMREWLRAVGISTTIQPEQP